ncbi:MAG: hypothetical protein LBG12_04855 [Synergistaceae bacterium]|nr:hypothetical protein [Synergistaceae bacterium]
MSVQGVPFRFAPGGYTPKATQRYSRLPSFVVSSAMFLPYSASAQAVLHPQE